MDKNYWKDAYQHLWEASSSKEKLVKKMIEDNTGYSVLEIGLGAGSSEYIPGSASDNKYEKGDTDLFIEDVGGFVEVTGPNVPVSKDAPLWFRPDKLRNSIKKIRAGKGQFHFAFHLQTVKETGEKLIRVLMIDNEFDKRSNTFKIVNPKIRGKEEKYVEILPNDIALISFEQFINLIKPQED